MHILHTVLHTSYAVDMENLFNNQKASLVGDHFLRSPGLNAKIKGDIVRRNEMLVTIIEPTVLPT